MDGALQYRRPLDNDIWLKSARETHWRPRQKETRQSPESRETFGGLLQAAFAMTERENVAQYADGIARYMGMSTEELYSMPVAEFVERYESARLTHEINAAYDEELEQEDEEFLAHVKSYQGRVIADADADD